MAPPNAPRAPPPGCPRPRSSSIPQLWARRARCGPGAARSWVCRRPRPVARRRARPPAPSSPSKRLHQTSPRARRRSRRRIPPAHSQKCQNTARRGRRPASSCLRWRRAAASPGRTRRACEGRGASMAYPHAVVASMASGPKCKDAGRRPLLPSSMDVLPELGRAAVDVRATSLRREGDEERGPVGRRYSIEGREGRHVDAF